MSDLARKFRGFLLQRSTVIDMRGFWQGVNVHIGALLNDTVGTLAAARYVDGQDTIAAMIMGTGVCGPDPPAYVFFHRWCWGAIRMSQCTTHFSYLLTELFVI